MLLGGLSSFHCLDQTGVFGRRPWVGLLRFTPRARGLSTGCPGCGPGRLRQFLCFHFAFSSLALAFPPPAKGKVLDSRECADSSQPAQNQPGVGAPLTTFFTVTQRAGDDSVLQRRAGGPPDPPGDPQAECRPPPPCPEPERVDPAELSYPRGLRQDWPAKTQLSIRPGPTAGSLCGSAGRRER